MIENNKSLKNNKTGFVLLKPYSKWNSGFFVLIIKGILSSLSSLLVFNMLFYGFNIECDYALMSKIIIIATFVFTFLQINTFIMIGSYILALLKLFTYVKENVEVLKNGIMIIANQCYPIVSSALNLPYADGFENVMSNTYLAVNSVTAVVALLISMIMAVIVVKLSSKLLYALGIVGVFSLLSFFNCNISYKYAISLLVLFVLVFIADECKLSTFKLSVFSLFKRKYSNKVKLKTDILYSIQAMIFVCIVFIAVNFGFKWFYSLEKFDTAFNDEYSENIKITARDIAVMKYAEYKKFNSIGNVSLGNLGYISYIKPNFKGIPFRFITEPVTEGKLYFAQFIGQDYKYRYNTWSESSDDNSVMVNALKNKGADKKVFEIYSSSKNSYMPYVSEYNKYSYNEKNKAEVTAYKYKAVNIEDNEYTNYVNNTFLGIDEENKAVLDKICSEQGFSKADSNIDSKISDYLKNNFTYSTEAEVLPYGKDFINYFLEESKTGNFTQYASALTLIYRNIGIPARYVSGYAVEAGQTFAGNKMRGNRTNTLVRQANMYSWVEVYSDNGGWRIVDIIPAPSISDLEEKYGENAENTYTPDTSLDNYFRTIDKEKYSPSNMAKAGGKTLLKGLVLAILFTALIGSIILFVWSTYKHIIYSKSDNSKKAYIIMERLRKKLNISCKSYREMESEISKKYGEKRACEIIGLAEKCIFSNKAENEDIKRLKKLIKKK